MALLPDFTAQGDASPIFSEAAPVGGGSLFSLQYVYALARPPLVQNYTREQLWTRDTSLKRVGLSSVRVRSPFDGYNPFTTSTMGPINYLLEAGLRGTPIASGDEEWVGFSMYFPTNYNGSGVYVLTEPFANNHSAKYPQYGCGFTTGTNTTFTMQLFMGLLPNPGNVDFNPITLDSKIEPGPYAPVHANGYKATETLLGGTGMPVFTKGVWHDFYFHLIYRAKPDSGSSNLTSGVMEIWHQEVTADATTVTVPWQKIYSNKNDGTALINRAPHATHYFNSANGELADGGVFGKKSIYRVYRSSSASQINHDVIYWCGIWMRRQSEQAIRNFFAAASNPTAPTITSFTPTSGTAGVTSVVITGTNFTAATAVTFNAVASSYVVNSSTQITATVPATATTGRIQVTTASGTGTSATDFTVGATGGPVLPDPAPNHLRIGKPNIGSTSSGLVNDAKRVIKRSVGAGTSFSIDQAYAFLSGSTTVNHRVVVYDDDGAGGLPGTRLGMSDPVTNTASGSWVSIPFSTPANGSGDFIYIGLIEGGAGSASIGVDTVPGGLWFNADTYADGPSQPFGVTPTNSNLEISLVVDYTVTGDSVAPLFQSANITAGLLEMDYGEAFDPASVPDVSAFAVTVNQAAWPVNSVSLSGSSVLLTLGNPVDSNDNVTIAYTPPGSNPLQDVSGNDSVALAATSVSNLTQQQQGLRRIDPTSRIIGLARRIDASHRRAGEGGGL